MKTQRKGMQQAVGSYPQSPGRSRAHPHTERWEAAQRSTEIDPSTRERMNASHATPADSGRVRGGGGGKSEKSEVERGVGEVRVGDTNSHICDTNSHTLFACLQGVSSIVSLVCSHADLGVPKRWLVRERAVSC